MKKYIAIVVLMLFALTGCMYPQEKMQQVPYQDQLNAVQTAVNQYKEANGGLLPIKTRDMNTPIYQKYPVDFTKLAPQFMQEPPLNAFENGGVYQYVLIDVETNPTVKLIDLRVTEKIRELKLKIQMYRDEHQYPPFQKMLANGVYMLDYKKLNYKEAPMAQSPYSDQTLPFVIDGQGEIYVDYSLELFSLLKKNKEVVKEGDDIRFLLTKYSPFVPVYSLPYTVKNNEPIFFIQ